MTELEKILLRHEGLRLKPYKDTVGKLTIGIGRNLDDKGISEEEAYNMLRNDIAECKKQLSGYYWYVRADGVRQNALVDMCFNLGILGLLRFKNMIAALTDGNYEKAAEEALNSKWAKQVGRRSEEIANMIKTGKYNGL